jgi:hypothetical protein
MFGPVPAFPVTPLAKALNHSDLSFGKKYAESYKICRDNGSDDDRQNFILRRTQ